MFDSQQAKLYVRVRVFSQGTGQSDVVCVMVFIGAWCGVQVVLLSWWIDGDDEQDGQKG